MKNTIKYLSAVLLSLCLLLSSAFASTTPARSPDKIDWEVDMRIVSTLSDTHAFLLFHNGSNVSITIGHFNLDPDEYLTVGTFGNRTAHTGIWYNIEGYYASSYSQQTNASLFYSLSPNDLDTLNSAINSHDSWELLSDNCAHFAYKVWNSVVPASQEVSGSTPSVLYNSIRKVYDSKKKEYVADLDISLANYQKNANQIARHTATSYVFDSSGSASSHSYPGDDFMAGIGSAD